MAKLEAAASEVAGEIELDEKISVACGKGNEAEVGRESSRIWDPEARRERVCPNDHSHAYGNARAHYSQ